MRTDGFGAAGVWQALQQAARHAGEAALRRGGTLIHWTALLLLASRGQRQHEVLALAVCGLQHRSLHVLLAGLQCNA